ncbi:MAG: DUF4358 domain-containing protein [Clostridiales bacterium]|nr:DUF4358 domain-containing protein [Clostridiales bacterium]
MKKLVTILLAALIAAASLVGCSAPKKETVSMYDLSQAMLSAHGDPDSMAYASSSDADPAVKLSYVSDVDYSKVEAFFISYAKDGKGNSDEIVVIAMKEEADAAEAAASLQEHIKKRISLYSTYDPMQVTALEKAEIFTERQYAVLVVAKNSEEIISAFNDFVK